MAQHIVHVRLFCLRGCDHDLGVQISHEVPPSLRWEAEAGPGFGHGGGGCPVPADLVAQVMRKLRESLEDCRRLGFVPIYAQ
jgi:hypothetical protein